MTAFDTLPLRAELLAPLARLDYLTMTPVQAEALPRVLAGQDLIIQAPTGSGKTAAFALGLLQKLEVNFFRIQSLVLCPTRELADQVASEIRRLASGLPNVKVLTLCGGQPLGPQIQSLEQGAHILVGTPGRIDDHLRKGHLQLQQIKLLVLDEADRMLDMGFQETLDAILAQLPQQRQTLLFSATFPERIASLAARLLHNPQRITLAATKQEAGSIRQHFYRLPSEQHRLAALEQLLLHFAPGCGVVFCTTRKETQAVAEALGQAGFSAQALHGDMEQKERDQTLIQFANKSIRLLVATDVAARGLDIAALDAVFNYQLSPDPEVHVHRVGRTGRAGAEGLACSLFTAAEDFRLAALADYLQQPLVPEPLPPAAKALQPTPAPMRTLLIDGGKKDKLRPGDILGALTASGTLQGEQIGKIQISARRAFVAVERKQAAEALQLLTQGKLKGRNFRARLLQG